MSGVGLQWMGIETGGGSRGGEEQKIRGAEEQKIRGAEGEKKKCLK